ncbi:MAG: sigma-70 family RNA polymerase sigma factor [Opitutales bacterium]
MTQSNSDLQLTEQGSMAKEDIVLMQRVAAGEDAAMALLIDRWKKPLLRFFHRSLRSLADAEELAQTTFLKLYRAAGRYKPSAKFSTYLFTIARHVLLDEIKYRARHPADPTDPSELRVQVQLKDEPRTSEVEEAFEQCLQALPENQRTALLLRVQRELTYEEIATIMKASNGAVKTWIHRARDHLRGHLKQLL